VEYDYYCNFNVLGPFEFFLFVFSNKLRNATLLEIILLVGISFIEQCSGIEAILL